MAGGAPVAPPPAFPPASPPPETTAGSLIFSILITTVGAAILAFSMIVQRYALAYPSNKVPVGCLHLGRNKVWALGLGLYLVANVCKAIGFNYGPLTVLASVFTTLLIFNLWMAKRLLGEPITPPKIAGAVLILFGAFVSCAGTPGLTGGSSPPTQFSPADMRELLSKPAPVLTGTPQGRRAGRAVMYRMLCLLRPPPHGMFFGLLVMLFVGSSVVVILRNERLHPFSEHELNPSVTQVAKVGSRRMLSIRGEAGSLAERPRAVSRDSHGRGVAEKSEHQLAKMQAYLSTKGLDRLSAAAQRHTSPERRQSADFQDFELKRSASLSSHRQSHCTTALLMLIYAGSLGFDEVLADLSTRAYSSMLATCEPFHSCVTSSEAWVFVLAVVIAIGCGIASALFWMRVVYRKYETTVALPIEYGALNAGNLIGGLLVYGEDGYMEGWQIGVAATGLVIILVGIGVGQLHELHRPHMPHLPRSFRSGRGGGARAAGPAAASPDGPAAGGAERGGDSVREASKVGGLQRELQRETQNETQSETQSELQSELPTMQGSPAPRLGGVATLESVHVVCGGGADAAPAAPSTEALPAEVSSSAATTPKSPSKSPKGQLLMQTVSHI